MPDYSGMWWFSASNYIRMSPGSFVGTGAWSMAVLARPDSTNSQFMAAYNGSTSQNDLYLDTQHIYGPDDFSSGYGTLTTNGTQWYVIVITKPAGSAHYRCHYWAYNSSATGSFSHGESVGAGNHADYTTAATDLWIGRAYSTVGGNGIISVTAAWDRALSDAEVDTLKSTHLTAWKALSPKFLVPLNEWDGVNKVYDKGGTSTFTSLTGSIDVVSPAPGFDFTLAPTVPILYNKFDSTSAGVAPSTIGPNYTCDAFGSITIVTDSGHAGVIRNLDLGYLNASLPVDTDTVTGLSISLWYRFVSSTADDTTSGYGSQILQIRDPVGNGMAPIGVYFYDGTLYGIVAPAGVYDVVLGTATDVLAWHHYAISVDKSGSAVFYFDGVSKGSYPVTDWPGDFAEFDLATNSNNNGIFDELRIYDGPITAAQVLKDMEGPPTVTGTRSLSLTATGTLGVTTSATGTRPLSLATAGTVALVKSATGTRPLTLTTAGAVSLTKTATGTAPLALSTTGALSVTRAVSGTAPLALSRTGTDAVDRPVSGTASLGLSTAASATVTPPVGGPVNVDGQVNAILVRIAAVVAERAMPGDMPLGLAVTGDISVKPPWQFTGTVPLALDSTGLLAGVRSVSGSTAMALSTAGAIQREQPLSGNTSFGLVTAGALNLVKDFSLNGDTELGLVTAGTLSVTRLLAGNRGFSINTISSVYENVAGADASIQDAGWHYFATGQPYTPSRMDAERAFWGGSGSVADQKRAVLNYLSPGRSLADMERVYYPEAPTPTGSLDDSKLDYWRSRGTAVLPPGITASGNADLSLGISGTIGTSRTPIGISGSPVALSLAVTGALDVVSGASPYDADTQAYLNATGLNVSYAPALDELVKGLKAYGLWSKMKAIYPFVGGTADLHKWNLKDPRDLDAAYRLTYTGGATSTHSNALGYRANPLGGSVAGYADTHLVPLGTLALNSTHLSFYSLEDTPPGDRAEMGCFNWTGTSASRFHIIARYTGVNAYYFGMSEEGASSVGVPAADGLFATTRTSSSSTTAFRNGSLLYTSGAAPAAGLPTSSVFIGAINYFANKSDIPCGFASIGDGLTEQENIDLYKVVQTYETSLGRQSGPPMVSWSPASLSGLVTWLDAADYLPGLWSNKSSGPTPTIGGTPAMALSTVTQNGRPLVRFRFGEGRLRSTWTDGVFDWTVIYLVRFVGPNAGRAFSVQYPPSNLLIGMHSSGADLAYFNGTFIYGPGGWDNTWRLYGGDSVLGGVDRFFINGTLIGGVAESTTYGMTGGWGISGYEASSAETMDIEVAEVVVYNRKLSDTERAQVEAYLRTKWGLP